MERNEISGIFEGPITPVAIKIGMPILIANFVQLFYMAADTYFISLIDKSSTALLSGTGLLFPLFFLFIAIANSLSIGISTITGRVIGEKSRHTARHISASGFLISLIIALPMALIGYLFKEPFLNMLAGSEMSKEAISYGVQYFTLLLPGLVLIIFLHTLGGILIGEGMTRIIGITMILSTFINIVLDPVFIFLLGMGVAGAGLATSLSIAIAAIFMLISSIKSNTSTPIHFNIFLARLGLIKEMILIGFPQFLSMATVSIGIMILNNLVGNIGELYMNAWTIVGRLDQILLIPGMAVATSTVTMISQNFGRNNLDRVRLIYKYNVVLVIIMVAIAAIAYIVIVPVFFPIFSSLKEVVDAAVLQVRLTAITYIGIGITFASVSAFQSTGKAFPAVAMSIFRLGFITIPLAFLLVNVYDLQMMGVYLACILGNLCIAPFSFFWTSRHLKRVAFRAVV